MSWCRSNDTMSTDLLFRFFCHRVEICCTAGLLRLDKLRLTKCLAKTTFVNSQARKTVCGMFSLLWMIRFCRRGFSWFALIYEPTALPCGTGLSVSLRFAHGEFVRFTWCYWWDICLCLIVSGLCVRPRIRNPLIIVESTCLKRHALCTCLSSIRGCYSSGFVMSSMPPGKVFSLHSSQTHAYFQRHFKACLHTGNNMFWYVSGVLQDHQRSKQILI